MLDDLTTPADLDGATLGPVQVALTSDRIRFYVDATGDDAGRWGDTAPPGFGSVLLFAVADLFLYHPRIEPFTATLLHVDQSFSYEAPMRAGTTITMVGTITRVRERGGSFFVTFSAAGTDDRGRVLTSMSTFVLSDQPAPPPESERDEPPALRRSVDMQPGGASRSASRHDLVRYAAATRDFNPLHWDHDVAVAAGLPGTVVHGLLMYAWMMQSATAAAGGCDVVEAKVRFRQALHPAETASVSAVAEDDLVRLELSREGALLVTGTATVAREE
jgi:acyl dehydratase